MTDKPAKILIDAPSLATEIVKALQEADQTHLWVNREEHAKHHAYIEILLKKQVEREERRDRITERIMGTAILAGGLWLIGLIGHYALIYLQTVLNHLSATPTPPTH